MKYIVILFMILNLNLTSKEKKELNNNQEIFVKIVDEKTNESLAGVKNINNKTYSDFDGILKINKGETIKLELVSYEKLTSTKIKNDTIIKMNIIK